MSIFFGSRGPIQPPDFTSLQVSTSSALLPIAIVHGSPLVATNLILAENFTAHKQSSKKIGGNKSGQSATTYTVDGILALAEGPAVEPPSNVPALRVNGQFSPIGGALTGTYDTFTFYTGAGPPYGFGAGGGVDYRPYPGVVLFVSGGLTAGANASIPQIEIGLGYRLYNTCPLNFDTATGTNDDADPAQVWIEYLTHPRFGAGFPAQFLYGVADGNQGLPGAFFSGGNAIISGLGDPAFQTYLQAAGFGFSSVLRGNETMASILDRQAKLLGVNVVWSGLALKIYPRWYGPVSLNTGWYSSNTCGPGGATIPLKYYTPYVTPLVDLTDDDFLQAKSGDQPTPMMRKDPADCYNRVRVAIRDRTNEYSSYPVEYVIENDIDTGDAFSVPFNRYEDLMGEDEFTFTAYGNISAQMRATLNMTVRTTGSFKLGSEYAWLEPMDPITITIPGLPSRFLARLTAVAEQPDMTLDCEWEEVPLGYSAFPLFPTPGSNNSGFDTDAVPDSVNPPLLFDVPSVLGSNTIGMALSGGSGGVADPNWGGCHIWKSYDGINYTQVGVQYGPSTMGLTTATLAVYGGANPDTINTLAVNLAESAGQLSSVSSGTAAAEGNRVIVYSSSIPEKEFISIETATPVSGFAYNCTNLWRNLDGSSPGSTFPIGSQIALYSSCFFLAIPSTDIGLTLHFKFTSFNTFGLQEQALSAATPYTFVP